ncbi:2TM domain-containing protein [Maribacter sp. 2308TA10-17]|uniref:2TM domain-containing protein n=1 Tax=Maribacter sp. 2308TA10-17 TaxID=3386276 RepID=UPI0039BCE77E
MEQISTEQYLRVKDKMKRITNFKWFLLMGFVASVVMIGFSAFLYSNEAQYSFVPITIFLATTLGLWIIIGIEYITVFKSNFFLEKSWEERQIEKYMRKFGE